MSGNTIGTIVGGAIGFVASGFNPVGLQYGMMIGGAIGGVLMPDEIGIQDQEGQRLNDLTISTSVYGAPIPKVYGAYRIAGNIFWANPIRETKHVREEEAGKGGSSETYEVTTYTYAVDMAIGLCEGPIDGIRKIWADAVLIYDISTGGTTASYMASEYASGALTFYLGTPTQTTDWFLQSNNPDSPAYRNLVYIVFNNFQLEQYGNRIPNITAEVVTSGTPSGVTLSSKTVLGDLIPSFGQYYSWCLDSTPNNYPTSRLYKPDATVDHKLLLSNGDGVTVKGETVTVDCRLHLRSFDGSIQALASKYYSFLLSRAYTDGTTYWAGSGLPVLPEYNNKAYRMNGSVYALTKSPTDTYQYTYLVQLLPVSPLNSSGVSPAIILYTGAPWCIHPYGDGYVLLSSDHTVSILNSGFAEIDSFDISSAGLSFTESAANAQADIVGISNNILYLVGGSLNFYACSLLDKTITHIGTVPVADHGELHDINRLNTWSISNNIIYMHCIRDGTDKAYYNTFLVNTLDRNQVTLSSILEDLLLKSGLSQSDFDLTEGNSVFISGFIISKTASARASIAALQSVYLFDLIEDGFVLKLVIRGGSPLLTINSNDFIYDNNSSINLISKLDTELPRKLTITYSNSDYDYQTSSQSTLRLSSVSDNVVTIEAPLVLSNTEAKQLAEKLMYSTWTGKLEITFSTVMILNLKVSDVINIDHDNVIYTIRITSIVYGTDGTFTYRAIKDFDSSYSSSAEGSNTDGFIKYTPPYLSPSNLLMMNSPTLINSLLSSAGLYYAASGYYDGWKGCEVYKSIDEGQTYNSIGAVLNGTVIGLSKTILADGPYTVFDLNNSVTINVSYGLLIDSSYEGLLNGQNYIKLGSEILQYMESVDNLDGTFTLSKFLRGRRGTEWATASHIIGEDFVLLSTNLGFAYSTINVSNLYKGVTFGTYLDNAIEVNETYDGTNLKPFAPANLFVNGLVISWVRRDRYVSGYFRTLPNSETQEKYKIEFFYLDVSQGFEEILGLTEYTYSAVTYPDVDKIQVSQYSDYLLGYGYASEVLI